jgi:hypothetical protein
MRFLNIVIFAGFFSVLTIVGQVPSSQRPNPKTTPKEKPKGYIAFHWEELSPKECQCKILFPGSPMANHKASQFLTDEKQYEWVTPTEYLQFRMGFSKMPVALKQDDEAFMYNFFENYIARMAKGANMSVMERSHLRIGGAYGIEVSFADGELISVNRYIYKDQTLYLLMTTGYKETYADPGLRKVRSKFLESFSFTN